MSLDEVAVLQGHGDRVWSAAWSPEGELLATCSGDKTIRIWGLEEAKDRWCCKVVLQDAHSRTIRCCSWSPDGRHLASASFDGTTAIWERQKCTWEQVATLEGHENEVKSVAWSPDGSLLATCGRDKSVWIWEALPRHEFECVDVKHGHSQDVKMVAWHPGGEHLFSCSYDDSIKIWTSDGDDWTCMQTLAGHSSTVWSMCFEGGGQRMASCSDDRDVRVWVRAQAPLAGGGYVSAEEWRLQSRLSGYHERTVFGIDWSSDGVIATGDGSNTIRIFGETTPSAGIVANSGGGSWVLLCTRVGAHDSDVNAVRWNPTDPSLLASAGDDGTVRLWRWRANPELLVQ